MVLFDLVEALEAKSRMMRGRQSMGRDVYEGGESERRSSGVIGL